MSSAYAWLGTLVIGVAAIAGATVAVALGHIDGQSYTGLVSGVVGVGLGVGAHATGVSSGNPPAGGAVVKTDAPSTATVAPTAPASGGQGAVAGQ